MERRGCETRDAAWIGARHQAACLTACPDVRFTAPTRVTYLEAKKKLTPQTTMSHASHCCSTVARAAFAAAAPSSQTYLSRPLATDGTRPSVRGNSRLDDSCPTDFAAISGCSYRSGRLAACIHVLIRQLPVWSWLNATASSHWPLGPSSIRLQCPLQHAAEALEQYMIHSLQPHDLNLLLGTDNVDGQGDIILRFVAEVALRY